MGFQTTRCREKMRLARTPSVARPAVLAPALPWLSLVELHPCRAPLRFTKSPKFNPSQETNPTALPTPPEIKPSADGRPGKFRVVARSHPRIAIASSLETLRRGDWSGSHLFVHRFAKRTC